MPNIEIYNPDEALTPLFELISPEEAMPQLVVTDSPNPTNVTLVDDLLKHPTLANKPLLAAGLYLYVDDLYKSHTISQGIDNQTGSLWHAIMHRREGDFSNARYWLHHTGNHPAIANLANYTPNRFVDEVEEAHPQAPENLVDRQRQEWTALFNWCAQQ